MQAACGAGSRFYNYKSIQSIILMAVVDGNYRFTYIDIGCNGRVSDEVNQNCINYQDSKLIIHVSVNRR